MNKVLVTGGSGFVGSNLIKKIRKDYPNCTIYSLDNYFTGSKDNHIEGVTYIEGNTWDIFNKYGQKINFGSEPFDTVFHFGEYSRIVQSFDDKDYVMKSNLYGTTQILKYCIENNSKLIYSASSSKFGNGGEDENLSPYSWTKAKMVELIKNYNKWFNLQYEICYFFNVYGPGQIMEGDYATVVGIFERQFKNGESLTVVKPGTQTRDFTHIEDVIDGVIKSTKMNMNKEWHLRSGKNIPIIEVAEMFTDNWKFIPERRGERDKSEMFESDTNEVLGWSPKWELKYWINEIKKGN